jgi:hypothetical protein
MAGFHKKTLRIAFALLFISLLISIILFLYGTDNWPGTDGLAAETAADAAAAQKDIDDAVTASNIWTCTGKFDTTGGTTSFNNDGNYGKMYACTVGSKMAEEVGVSGTPTWKCAGTKGEPVGDTNYTGCTFVTKAKVDACVSDNKEWSYDLAQCNSVYSDATSDINSPLNDGQECEGDCGNDADCAGDLKCWKREADEDGPNSCSGEPNRDKGWDYCYDELKTTNNNSSARPSTPW